jgi:hypothetical protein
MNLLRAGADFFLGSSEGYGLKQPRRCRVLGDYVTDSGKDAVLVSVEPAIALPDGSATQVVLVPRHAGETVRRPRSWPVAVHVALPRPACRETSYSPRISSRSGGQRFTLRSGRSTGIQLTAMLLIVKTRSRSVTTGMLALALALWLGAMS